MILIFANNAKTTIAGAITSTSTTLNLYPGTGSLFPNPGANQYFILTLTDAATGLINEIVWVTSRSGDVLTILRGQDNTAAKSWLIGDFSGCYPTAGTQGVFLQPDQAQKGTYEYGVAAGTVNAATASINSDLTSLPDGMPLTIRAFGENTGAMTLQVTLVNGSTNTILAVSPIVKGGNQTLVAGDNPAAGYPMQLNWSSVFNSWVMQNPATGVSVIPTGAIFQFPCVTAPTGFLITQGQLLARATYPNLYSFAVASGNIISDASWLAGQYGSFSSGDGSTTFRLPQYGGYILRTLDNGNGIDPSRTIGTVQAGANQIHNHTASTTVSSSASTSISGTASTTINDPGHLHAEGVDLTLIGKQFLGNGTTEFAGSGSSQFGHGGAAFPSSLDHTGITASTTLSGLSASTSVSSSAATTVNNSSGASETRMINISVLTCIKY